MPECLVSGPALLPDGAIAPGAVLSFIRKPQTVVGQGGFAIIPETVSVTLDAGGLMSQAFVPGAYQGVCVIATARVTFDFGVPDQPTAVFSECVGLSVAIDPDSGLAILAAVARAEAWAESPTAPGDVDSRSAKSWAVQADAFSGDSEAAAGVALGHRDAAGVSAAASLAARAGAEDARDLAEVAAAAVGGFTSTGAGLAATTVGDSFYAPLGSAVGLYRHDTGPVATLIGGLASAEAFAAAIPDGLTVTDVFDPTYRWVQTFDGGELAWAQRHTGRLEGTGIGFQEDFFLGDANFSLGDDPRYVSVHLTADNRLLLAVTPQGQFVNYGGGLDASDTLYAPTWVAHGAQQLVPVFATGQSLSQGQESLFPASIVTAMADPVLPGRAFTFGSRGPRFMVNQGSGTQQAAGPETVRRMEDHTEKTAGAQGVTSAWSFIQQVASVLPGANFITMNTSVGGSTIQIVNGGESAKSRRLGLVAARRYADKFMTPFGRTGIVMLDHGNANRPDLFEDHKALIRSVLRIYDADFAAAGGIPDGENPGEGLFTVLGAPAGVYSVGFFASDVPIAQLAVALEDPRVCIWGPEYISVQAIGANANGADDPVHRSAMGQMAVGVYQARAIAAILSGVKRNPLYCAGTATLAGDGLSASWTYTNPEAGSLTIDTSLVSNPATDATYEAIDTSRPYGVMLTDATGKAPHATRTVTGVSVLGNVVTATFSGVVAGAAMINVANYNSTGNNAFQGTRHGARACIRNTTSAAAVTIGGVSVTPHDYVMPQRINIL